MSALPFVFGGVVLLTVFLTVEVLTRDLRLKGKMRRLARTPVSSMAAGRLTKIVGTVATRDGGLTAPVSGEGCVFYHAIEEELVDYYASGARIEKWMQVGEEQDACGFTVADETGAASVEGDADSIVVVLPARAYAAHQEGKSRWREARLTAGDQVSVIGVVALEVDPAAAGERLYRDAPGTRPVLRGSARAPLLVERG